ncbi:MAG: type II toxin-antitoxin system RelE/ParE family toxin [Candidatus Eremiobacteraeota bacterium]|nr:type II toxin-antitoxin system RelE/ParE family toxin [Candidatus Eremiobacteraeota bacterium]MBV8433974.1 type II toxin-antitoxin system RelE/ParE family toxin [Candidatus Eremiobacteraeota bacterium]MBV8584359.1 type II toxin-antitoxin system RelE/ParE family toxin [Candidatus Eremiobacteraeota bacterium]
MKRQTTYAGQARIDLVRIWQYIASSHGPAPADSVVRRIGAAMRDVIQKHPNVGRSRPEFGNVRSYPVVPYVVFYRVDSQRVEVLRIVHGHRDIREPLMSLLAAV